MAVMGIQAYRSGTLKITAIIQSQMVCPSALIVAGLKLA
jgi:hypothetical protein